MGRMTLHFKQGPKFKQKVVVSSKVVSIECVERMKQNYLRNQYRGK